MTAQLHAQDTERDWLHQKINVNLLTIKKHKTKYPRKKDKITKQISKFPSIECKESRIFR